MPRAYLDHASTSPLRPTARAALRAALDGEDLGDPGRIHHEGMAARVALEQAREEVAAAFGARSREVVLTSGATESIAAASFGARARAAAGLSSSMASPWFPRRAGWRASFIRGTTPRVSSAA